MRTSLRRALACATAITLGCVAPLLGIATPAAALDSSLCPESDSTRLLTANDGSYKVWLYQANGDMFLCFAGGSIGGGVFVFRGSLVPSVTRDIDASDCSSFFSLQDPIDVTVQLQLTSFTPPLYFCIGVGGTAVGVTVTAANGPVQPELWLDPSHRVF